MTRTLTIPVAPSRMIEVQFPDQNLSPTEWAVLMAVLDAMRPGLAEPALVDAMIIDERDPDADQRILAARTLRDEAHRLASTFPNDGVAEHVAELRNAADALDWFERDTATTIVDGYVLASRHPISEHPGRRDE